MLDRVANGVAEVQQRSRAGSVVLILRDDRGFNLDVATHELGQLRAIEVLEQIEQRGIGDHCMLDDLREALMELAFRQRRRRSTSARTSAG